MTSPIKPATALPWKYGESSLHIYSANTGQHIATVIRHSPMTYLGQAARDADYIAHACNAYPELVAALREVADQRTTHLRSNQMQDALNERKAKARALLSKLGEG